MFRSTASSISLPALGPHPTLVICHGLPGNEKNLDLAQAVRRSGWNAVTFNYRGSWGSPGHFSFSQNLEDADAVLAFLRDPTQAASLGIDTKRLAIAGHSMGGWVVAHTAAHDHALIGAILISPADMGRIGEQPRKAVIARMAGNMESLAGVTAESMADEVIQNAKAFRMTNAAAGLANVPLLALTADDGLAPDTEALLKAIREHGGKNITERHVATDHSWSDHRIALETIVVTWLQQLITHGGSFAFICGQSSPGSIYSCRSATIGSVRIARSAGMKQANSATAQSKHATVKKVSASVLVTPSSMLFKKRVRPKAAASPRPMPTNVKRSPCPSTSRRTSSLLAPSAMRMPISWTRCRVVYDVTP